MPVGRTQIRLGALTGSMANTDQTAATGLDTTSLQGVMDEVSAALIRITGATKWDNAPAGTFAQTIKSSTDAMDIGAAASAEQWGNLYLGTAKGLYIGADQGGFVKDTEGELTIGTLSDAIVIGGDTHTGAIDIGNVNQTKTITVGNAGATEVQVDAILVDINGGTGGVTIDGGAASNFTTSAGDLAITSAATLDIDGVAVTIDSSGALDITAANGQTLSLNHGGGSALTMSATGAVEIAGESASPVTIGAVEATATLKTTTSGDVDIQSAGAVDIDGLGVQINSAGVAANLTVASDADAEDLTIEVTGANDASVLVKSSGTGDDAISLAASAGGIEITVPTTKSVMMGLTGEAEILVSPHSTAANELIAITNTNGTAANAIALDASAGGFSIDGAAASNVTTSAGALTLNGAAGETIGTTGQNSAFQGSVVITQDLTVNGTTTTVDTTNLTVEDPIIACGYDGDGGDFAAAADRALMMGIAGVTENPVMVWSNATTKPGGVGTGTFAFATTTSAQDATVVALSTAAPLQVGDFEMKGNYINLKTQAVSTHLANNVAGLTMKTNAGVAIAQWDGTAAKGGLLMNDDYEVQFGTGGDASIKYTNVGSIDDFVIEATGNTDMRFRVALGDELGFEVNAAEVLKVDGTRVLISQKLQGPALTNMLISGSENRNVIVSAGDTAGTPSALGQVGFEDGNKLGSTWSASNPIFLSTAKADWTNYVTKFGDNTSILAAIKLAAEAGSPGTTAKTQKGLTAGVASGSLLSTAVPTGGGTVGTFNLSDMTVAQRQKHVDIYINGQQMFSGSADNCGATPPTADYTLMDGGQNDGRTGVIKAPATSDFGFSFAIEADDVVTVMIR